MRCPYSHSWDLGYLRGHLGKLQLLLSLLQHLCPTPSVDCMDSRGSRYNLVLANTCSAYRLSALHCFLYTVHISKFQSTVCSAVDSLRAASTFRIYFIPSQSTSRLLKSLCILASSGPKLVCSDSDGTRICKNKNIPYVQHTSKTSLFRSCPPADGLRQLLLTSLNLIFPWVIPIDRINGSLARLSWLSWLRSPTCNDEFREFHAFHSSICMSFPEDKRTPAPPNLTRNEYSTKPPLPAEVPSYSKAH